jgi:cell division protein FtsA
VENGRIENFGGFSMAESMTRYPERLVFGLDIGTRSIVGTVGYRENDNNFKVIAMAAKQHETRAMLDGQIHDIGKVAETIKDIKEQLERKLKRKLSDVCIAAAGRVLRTISVTAEQEYEKEIVIAPEHIHSLEMLAVEKAYDEMRSSVEKDEEASIYKFYCVGYSVTHYYMNGYQISNLEGHKAAKLKIDLLATFLPEEVIDGLYAAVERAGLYVANLTLEPIAAINIAIPEKYRLLNIGLVDVGAGTSDISITKDGSIVAYGMIPSAGDELTECIAKKYLVDFQTAEDIKVAAIKEESIEYQDIMGLPMTVSSEEVVETVSEIVKQITKSVADKIKELNGDKSVSAVFVVGGGGKIPGFVTYLAEYLDLPPQRVALRGAEVLQTVEFLDKDFEKDSLYVTPVGICMSFYEHNNNFIFVRVNGERIKLYDNGRLSIADAAVQVGLSNESLFPKRGKSIQYTLNGAARMARGLAGEAAVILLNGEEASINTKLSQNDVIEIKESTTGEDAHMDIGELPEYNAEIRFHFDGQEVSCPKFVMANGELVSGFYGIKDGDDIHILNYYTLQQVLDVMDLPFFKGVLVNNEPAEPETKVYEQFSIRYADQKEHIKFPEKDGDGEKKIEEVTEENVVENKENGGENGVKNMEEAAGKDAEEYGMKNMEEAAWESAEEYGEESMEENAEEAFFGEAEPDYDTEESGGEPEQEKIQQPPARDLAITVNDQTVILKNKYNYLFVDILDFYPFDTKTAGGTDVEMTVNGIPAEFMTPLHEGDKVSLFWKN